MTVVVFLQILVAVVIAAMGSAIASIVWYAYQNQTDPESWDMNKFAATVILGMMVGVVQYLTTGVMVTYETIGPLIMAYAFAIPFVQMVIVYIVRVVTNYIPQGVKVYRHNIQNGEIKEVTGEMPGGEQGHYQVFFHRPR